MIKKNFLISALFLLMAGWSTAVAEDGSRLCLRFNNANTTATITGVKGTALTELQTYWQGGP